MSYSGPPDWVILGAPQSDGTVVILASKDLTEAELTKETEHIRGWSGEYLRSLPTRRELTVGMRTYVMVTADTYEQALRKLFDHWSPEPDTTAKALDPAQRAITS